MKSEFNDDQLGILCLQEVNTNISGINVLDVIKSELGENWDYTFFSPQNNTYGIAIISNIEHTKEQFWDLPVPQNNEERGAIALKFKLDTNFVWVVNTHLGLDNNYQIEQIEEIKNNYLTFDEIVPVLIAGDFNIEDINNHGDNVEITSEDVIHYGNTIQELIDSGVEKIEYEDTENRKYSFHSWNSVSNGRTIDYIFWLDRQDRPSPKISTLRPGPYNTTTINSVCPEYQSTNRYFSDHNGLMIKHALF